MIESWPDQYQAFVGERGISLSGGQIQRTGIARALYKGAGVNIFDEATGALGNKRERTVIDAIKSIIHDLTIMIAAHRQTVLQDCDQIIEFGSGSSFRIGAYHELVVHPSITK